MARCFICDRSDSGLSQYLTDVSPHAAHFRRDINGRIVCDSCDDVFNELMSDFYDSDIEDEETETPFEWEETNESD